MNAGDQMQTSAGTVNTASVSRSSQQLFVQLIQRVFFVGVIYPPCLLHYFKVTLLQTHAHEVILNIISYHQISIVRRQCEIKGHASVIKLMFQFHYICKTDVTYLHDVCNARFKNIDHFVYCQNQVSIDCFLKLKFMA